MPSESLTVAEVLRQQASARADHPFLVCDAERLSYAEADRRSAQLARGLIALGAGKGTHVGLLHPNGEAFVVGMLAAARIGAVVIPFSTFATAPELASQLVDSDTEILLAAASFRSHDYRQRLADIKGAAPLLRHVLIDSEPGDTVDADAARGDGTRRRRIGSAGHCLHVGLDERAEGRGAHPRCPCWATRRFSTRSAG